jgi:hypothetical protein
VLVEYLIPMKSTATAQGEHVLFDIDVKGGEKMWSRCYSWRYKHNSAAFQGFHPCQRGRLLACFYRKSVLVIDGKNNSDDGKQESISSGGEANSMQRSKIRRKSAVQKRDQDQHLHRTNQDH